MKIKIKNISQLAALRSVRKEGCGPPWLFPIRKRKKRVIVKDGKERLIISK